jgi:excisionase family DNA binding protein
MIGEAVQQVGNQLSVPQTAKVLGCSPWLVWELINRGELVSARVGRLVRIDPAELARYLKRSKRVVE